MSLPPVSPATRLFTAGWLNGAARSAEFASRRVGSDAKARAFALADSGRTEGYNAARRRFALARRRIDDGLSIAGAVRAELARLQEAVAAARGAGQTGEGGSTGGTGGTGSTGGTGGSTGPDTPSAAPRENTSTANVESVNSLSELGYYGQGGITVAVSNPDGSRSVTTFQVDQNTSGEQLRQAFDAIDNVTARFVDGKLSVTADSGYAIRLTNTDIRTGNAPLDAIGLTDNATDANWTRANKDLYWQDQIRNVTGVNSATTLEIDASGRQTSLVVDPNWSGQELARRLDEVAGLDAILDNDGFLSVRASDGGAFTINDTSGGNKLLKGLGFGGDISATTETAPPPANAGAGAPPEPFTISGIVDYNRVETNSELLIQLSSAASATAIKITNKTTAESFLAELNAIDYVSARIDNSTGELFITAEDGSDITLRNGNKRDIVSALGFTEGTYAAPPPPDPAPQPDPAPDPAPSPGPTTGSGGEASDALKAIYASVLGNISRLLSGGGGRDASLLAGGSAGLGLKPSDGYELDVQRFDLGEFGLASGRDLDGTGALDRLAGDLEKATAGLGIRDIGLRTASRVLDVTSVYVGAAEGIFAAKPEGAPASSDGAVKRASLLGEHIRALGGLRSYGLSAGYTSVLERF